MAKPIIIEWQKDSLIVAKCSGAAGSVQLEAVSHQPISATSEGAAENATTALARAVSELGLGKSDTSIVAPRSCVEVRTISVPRIEGEDLPDVIRFQAQRQLANMTDSWALDFLMLPDDPEQEMRTALVAAMPPQQVAEMEAICDASNLHLAHIALRPIEIARHALSAVGNSQSGVYLIICLSESMADLILVRDGQVVLLRSTKTPNEPEFIAQSIGGEIKRSLLAASSQLGKLPVQGGVLIATPAVSEKVEQVIADTIEASVSTIDPTGLLPADFTNREEFAICAAGRLTAIAGTAAMPAANSQTIVDFKNPKKRPPKQKKTKIFILAGVAAVLLLGAGISWWVKKNRELDGELARIEGDIESKQQLVELSQNKITELNQVKQFLEASPNFLEELVLIANKMPPAEKILVEEPQFNLLSDGSGRIRFNIKADEPATISAFEDSLRDEFHNVEGRDNRLSSTPTPLYKWEATELITIRDRGWKLLEQSSPTSTPKNATEVSDSVATASSEVSADEADGKPGAEADSTQAEPPQEALPADDGESGDEPATEPESSSDIAAMSTTSP